jgi:DNA modification methylase
VVTVRYLGTVDLPLAGLAQFPGNARRGDLEVIRASVARHGQYRSIVVRQLGDGSHVIVAGNHTALALAAEGHQTARADLIECDEDEARRINLADNRSAELGGYDDAALAVLLSSLDGDFAGTGWAQEDLDALLEPEKRTDPDDVPAAPAEPVTRLGDMWQLGSHRLLCGDATDAGDVARLMAGERAELAAADPPYNVGEDYATYADALSDGAYASFSGAWFAEVQAHSDRQIVTPGWTNLVVWCRLFEPYFVAPWTKSNSMTPGKVSRWTCWEPLMFFGGGWKTNRQRASDLFDFPIGQQKDTGGHPCPKPVAFWADLLENYSLPGATVLDVFGGAGTTLIAAHHTKRTARLLELDPHYCDVIVQRYRDHTGVEPELVDRASVAV